MKTFLKILVILLHIVIFVFLTVEHNLPAAIWSALVCFWWLMCVHGDALNLKLLKRMRAIREEYDEIIERNESQKWEMARKIAVERDRQIERNNNLLIELKGHRARQSQYDEVKTHIYVAANNKMYVYDSVTKKIVPIKSKTLKVKSVK